MEQRKFFDEGKVLSYVSLKVQPEDHGEPMDLVMVEIDNGPQLACWTDEPLRPTSASRSTRTGPSSAAGLHNRDEQRRPLT